MTSFWAIPPLQNSKGSSSAGALNTRSVEKTSDFRQKSPLGNGTRYAHSLLYTNHKHAADPSLWVLMTLSYLERQGVKIFWMISMPKRFDTRRYCVWLNLGAYLKTFWPFESGSPIIPFFLTPVPIPNSKSLYVCHSRCCIKTTKPILKLFRPSGSPGPIIEAFRTPCAETKFQGEPVHRGVKYSGVGKIGDFRRILPFISETVQNWSMVTMER